MAVVVYMIDEHTSIGAKRKYYPTLRAAFRSFRDVKNGEVIRLRWSNAVSKDTFLTALNRLAVTADESTTLARKEAGRITMNERAREYGNTTNALEAKAQITQGQDAQILPLIYRYIVDYKTANDGLAPTVREVADSFDIPSTSTAARLLDELRQSGDITPIIRGGRIVSYRVSGGEWVHNGKA